MSIASEAAHKEEIIALGEGVRVSPRALGRQPKSGGVVNIHVPTTPPKAIFCCWRLE